MKKVLIGLTLASSVFLVACSNQEQTKEEKKEVSNTKVAEKETTFHDYENGKKYGIYAANFDKEHGYDLASERHIGSNWDKEYTEGYEEGYNSVN